MKLKLVMGQILVEGKCRPATEENPWHRGPFSVRALRRISSCFVFSILALAQLWAFLALWYFEPWPPWIGVSTAMLWAMAVLSVWWFLPKARARKTVALGFLVVLLVWSLYGPSNGRNWAKNQGQMPTAEFDGDVVHIHNFRHTIYRTDRDFDVRWYDRSFNLNAIQSVDFLVTSFSSFRGPAHTFLTFGFEDGRYVAISVESRRQQDESFSPLMGFFKRFEIMYVVGD